MLEDGRRTGSRGHESKDGNNDIVMRAGAGGAPWAPASAVPRPSPRPRSAPGTDAAGDRQPWKTQYQRQTRAGTPYRTCVLRTLATLRSSTQAPVTQRNKRIIGNQGIGRACFSGRAQYLDHDFVGLPAEAPLTPLAARRLSRECSIQAFGPAARALAEDWGVEWDARQVQRWSEALGRSVVVERNRQVRQMEQGDPPQSPANEDQLLVIEVDGGRVQMRDKDQDTGSRWREDKVAAISTYLPGDGKKQKPTPTGLSRWCGWRPRSGACGRRPRCW